MPNSMAEFCLNDPEKTFMDWSENGCTRWGHRVNYEAAHRFQKARESVPPAELAPLNARGRCAGRRFGGSTALIEAPAERHRPAFAVALAPGYAADNHSCRGCVVSRRALWTTASPARSNPHRPVTGRFRCASLSP